MPRPEECANADCIRYSRYTEKLCDECKRKARILDQTLAEDAKYERLFYLTKNEGLGHRKGKRK